jgi:uncharacterized protein Veg
MGTYYGYAERNVDSQVNWAEVGKNITDMLSKETQLREEKKSAIEQASREYGKQLSNAPTGENQNINGTVLNFANDASQMMLMQDKLLKNGMLKLKDYAIARQNLTDGTSRLFDLSKEWQTVAREKMDRYKAGDASVTETDIMSMVEGFGRLKDTKIYINPTNGMISAAKTKRSIVDGKEVDVMDSDANNYNTINELGNFMKQRIDKYKVTDSLEEQVKATGTFIDSFIHDPRVQKTGSITLISDPTLKKNFDQYMKNVVDGQLDNPFNTLSVLRDWTVNPNTNKPYGISFNKEDKSNPDVIFLKKDGQGGFVPEFSKEQKKVAEEYMKTQFTHMLDREVKKQSIGEISQTNESGYAEQKRKANSDVLGQGLAMAIAGNDKAIVDQGLATIESIPGVKRADKEGNFITIETDSGRKHTYDIKGNLDQVFNQLVAKIKSEDAENIFDINPAYVKAKANKYAQDNKWSSYSPIDAMSPKKTTSEYANSEEKKVKLKGSASAAIGAGDIVLGK